MSSARSLFRLAAVCLVAAASGFTHAEPIAPSAKPPASIPWNLEKLSAPPAFEWVDETSEVRSLLYAGENYGGRATRVFAYYASPATLDATSKPDRRFPAVVLLHGGGGTAFRQWALLWAKRGYAAIAMDLAGARPLEGKDPFPLENRERLKDGGPDQGAEKFANIDKDVTEQWSYHAVASAIRAHSLIRSFPEVDADRTAVTGISWGGYLTCIIAGVDSRFKAAVPVYGCGFLQENSAWLKHFAEMTPPQRERWQRLWDPASYLPNVSMPILFINGTNDAAYPLDSYMKSYALVPGKKQLRITVNMPHGHPEGWAPQEIARFIDSQLRNGPSLPRVVDTQNDGETIEVKYEADGPVTANLHFTTDRGPVNQRTWTSLPATNSNNNSAAAAPPPDATAWFFTLTDTSGATVSSEVFFRILPSNGAVAR